MAKDPKYDRYAGMVTLPGDPLNLRKPRPFRVDEDGNVIYLDEEAGLRGPQAARTPARESWTGTNSTGGLENDRRR